MIEIYWAVTFAFGAIIGSFLNVCIYRLPRQKSIVLPPSKCPHCGYQLHWYDNIPIFSYLMLRGKCRSCKGAISIRYPFVEFASGILLTGLYMKYGLATEFFIYSVLIFCLITISFIDLDYQLILNVITIPGLVVGLLLTLFFASESIIEVLSGVAGGAGVLIAIAIFGNLLFKKESMGGGDIKLAAMIGAYLGLTGVLMALMIGFFSAAPIGALVLLWKGPHGDHKIPFGPFLSFGAICYIFSGQNILQFFHSYILN